MKKKRLLRMLITKCFSILFLAICSLLGVPTDQQHCSNKVFVFPHNLLLIWLCDLDKDEKVIDLGQPKSVAPGPGCSEPD